MPHKSSVSLIAFPLIVILVGWLFITELFPIYAGTPGYAADPAYVYLLNGPLILGGNVPFHIDHPGTPLQILCAGVIYLRWLATSPFSAYTDNVVTSVLRDPESYILSVSYVLLLLNAFAVHYLGRRINQATGSLKLALFCQSAPLAFWLVAQRTAYLSPEALLIFASLWLFGALAPVIFGESAQKNRPPSGTPTLAGLICGFGVAVKLTFIPMLGLLFLFKRRNNVIAAMLSAAATWIIMVSPIWSRLSTIYIWIYALFVHSGHYGAGPADVFNFDDLGDRIITIAGWFPFFFAMMAAFLACLLFAITRSPTGTLSKPEANGAAPLRTDGRLPRIPLILFLVCTIQSALVLKHPGPHYMTPVLPIAFIGAAWLTHVNGTLRLSARSREWLQSGLLGLAGVMTIHGTVTGLSYLHGKQQIQNAGLEAVRNELRKHANPLVLGSDNCILPECAMVFGLAYAPALEKNAAPLLENFRYYNYINRNIKVDGEGWVGPARIDSYIQQGREVFLVTPTLPGPYTSSMQPLVVTPTQSLYKVTSAATTDIANLRGNEHD